MMLELQLSPWVIWHAQGHAPKAPFCVNRIGIVLTIKQNSQTINAEIHDNISVTPNFKFEEEY